MVENAVEKANEVAIFVHEINMVVPSTHVQMDALLEIQANA